MATLKEKLDSLPKEKRDAIEARTKQLIEEETYLRCNDCGEYLEMMDGSGEEFCPECIKKEGP
jgi:Zn finger protein HypA/HybF involved in hydrogenase expression